MRGVPAPPQPRAIRRGRSAASHSTALLCGALALGSELAAIPPAVAPRRQLAQQLIPFALGLAGWPVAQEAGLVRAEEGLQQLPNDFYEETKKVSTKVKQALFDITGASGRKNKARFSDGQQQAQKFIERYRERYFAADAAVSEGLRSQPAFIKMKATLDKVQAEGYPEDATNTKYIYSLISDFENVIKRLDAAGVDPATMPAMLKEKTRLN